MKQTSEKTAMHRYGYEIPGMTVRRLMSDKAEKNGDKTFLTFLADQRSFSYRDVDLLSNRLARGLMALGLEPGSHVAVMMDNSPEQALMHFAIMKMGCVSVPVNTAARGKLLAYFLNHSDSVAVIAEAPFVERLAEVFASTPAIRNLVVQRPADAEAGAQPVSCEGVAVSDYAWLEQHPGETLPDTARFSDLAMLVYTSGTTGPSKGNMIAQATIVQYGMTTAESHGYRHDDTIYISLPINHSNAYFALWAAFIVDASVALSRRFSVSRFWKEIRDSGSTFTNLLGSTINMLWAQPGSTSDTGHRLRACMMVPVPKFAREWEKRFNTRVVSSYGQTDYANVAVYTLVDPADKLGSAGRPRAGVELRVVDENDVDVAPGEVGELLIRNNNPWAASMGYYKMPEATVAATRNLWWHTGDSAYIDAEGYLFFADRKKDTIRRRGENISAYEVESILLEHPAIADAAAYALSSEMSEDEVAVSVVLVDGARLDEAMLVEYCSAQMAHYMVPRYVQILETLPRTQNQKIQKFELRRRAEQDRDQLWDREKAGVKVQR